ncbi:chorismate synthase [bacterium]|nr:chorismate synthase [bacterium]
MGLRYLSAGESHGKALTAIIEGIPSLIKLKAEEIDEELARRQKGYGRGKRMQIEKDRVKIISGVRLGKTIGSPICLMIENKDWDNWQNIMSLVPDAAKMENRMTRPRPGHADLAGLIKYRHDDLRDILERASARETAIRVAVGAVCKALLREFDIRIISHVIQIGDVRAENIPDDPNKIWKNAEKSPLRCSDINSEIKMMAKIDKARQLGDSLGGIFEILAIGVPVGLGSYVSYDRRLDGRLAQSLMSIPAIKGVQIGMGFDSASKYGSQVHDEIFYQEDKGFYRKTNRAGGMEGGVTNGQPICVQAAMKPIPTLYKPLKSVDIVTKKPFDASVERSDICAVPAASVIGESCVAFEIARAFLERYGGDNLEQTKKAWQEDQDYLKAFY